MLHIVAPHAPQFFCGLSGIAPDSAFSTWRITLNILRQVKQTHLSLNSRAVIPSLPGNNRLRTMLIVRLRLGDHSLLHVRLSRVHRQDSVEEREKLEPYAMIKSGIPGNMTDSVADESCRRDT